MEVNSTTEKELVATEIARYMDLLRVKQAQDREKELETSSGNRGPSWKSLA